MKLHMGCGSVYLEGWVNVDVRGPSTFLARDRPDLVTRWKTSEDRYYGRHQDVTLESLRAGPRHQEYVCDTYGTFSNLPAQAWTVDEILARHSFEHLSMTEAHAALDQMDTVLHEGGLLRIDVPDHEASLEQLMATHDRFYIRHLLGPRRNDLGFHMMSYTRDRLRRLVEEHGFVFVSEEPNIHLYPAFCLRFIKPGLRPPRDYVELPELAPGSTILDVGPGPFPHPRATHYLDLNPDILRPLGLQGKTVIPANLTSGLPTVSNKEFDFIWCSHVFEHLDDPLAAAATLSRIGRRGVLIVPSVIKEALFNFEEADHRWLVLPHPKDLHCGAPIFVRHNPEYMQAVKNVEVQRITCRLFRTGPNRTDPEQRFLRSWFFNNEAALDVIVYWEGELNLRVFG